MSISGYGIVVKVESESHPVIKHTGKWMGPKNPVTRQIILVSPESENLLVNNNRIYTDSVSLLQETERIMEEK